jgi:outer membrane protein OmpA-like peptidoglycan-associated protein
MKTLQWLCCIAAMSGLFMPACAQESETQEQGGAPRQVSAIPAGKTITLDDMLTILEKNRAEFAADVNLTSLDLLVDVLGRIKATRAIAEKKPKDPQAISQVRACSLLTEAAVVQMKIAANRRLLDSLNAKNTAVAEDLSVVYDNISEFEHSRASELKAELGDKQRKLDEERRKAEALRAEAEKKFSQLRSALIQVSSDARGTIISMSDILFETNKANLTADLKTSLAKIAGILIVFKNSHVIVEGHTDNTGTEEYNQKLSEARAENVMNFLIEQGVAADRLNAVGYGLTKPIADNETKEGRQKNRRVDLIVQEDGEVK